LLKHLTTAIILITLVTLEACNGRVETYSPSTQIQINHANVIDEHLSETYSKWTIEELGE